MFSVEHASSTGPAVMEEGGGGGGGGPTGFLANCLIPNTSQSFLDSNVSAPLQEPSSVK